MTPSLVRADIGHTQRALRNRLAGFLGEHRARALRAIDNATPALWGSDVDKLEYPPSVRDRLPGAYSQQLIQSAVVGVFESMRKRNWAAYIVGGTLRDLMLGPAKAGVLGVVPRDIDVIVADAGLNELLECFNSIVARRTRFGGLHLVKQIAAGCEVHFDVWPLASTWAFMEYSKSPVIEAFPETPFLNLDSIAVELFPRGDSRQIYERGFFEGLADQILDINFEPNPFPDVCAVRALIMAAKLRFGMTRRLARFISGRFEEVGPKGFEAAQLSHYGKLRSVSHELCRWVDALKYQMKNGANKIEIAVSESRQSELWTDYPALS